MKKHTKGYAWKFQRIGGLDQIVLESSQDIAHLPELDRKLWVALSCPATGLEFNQATLSLLDKDNDKRIRIQDVMDAVTWVGQRLIHLNTIKDQNSCLSLSDINTETVEGQKILQTAKSILTNIDKKNAKTISEPDLELSNKLTANSIFNGDGVLPPLPQFGEEEVQFIKDAVNVIGGVQDLSGANGINSEIAKAFIVSLTQWLEWRHSLGAVSTPFKENTSEVWQLVDNLKDKIDDYFMRTQLADYAPQAETALNISEKFIVPEENGLLNNHTLAALPLSRIEPDKPLNLKSGLNPVWRDKVARFGTLVKRFLRHAEKLSFDEWLHIQNLISPYTEATKSKPIPISVPITMKPTLTIDTLGEKRVDTILKSGIGNKVIALAEKDSTTPAVASDMADVRRLVLYHHYLYRLLLNFASFHDFFDLDRTATFQDGQLYIDGRCCTLCIPVENIATHIVLANYSELFLLYCQCTRKNPTGDPAQDKKLIVAAMTAGDSDFLLNGRNGVYVDNYGNDWDATVVNMIVKPISIPQAIWSPYKRFGRFITAQLNKWTSLKDAAVSGTTQTAAATSVVPAKFDLSRSMGIFAAIGLAIGAIGTAVATILHSLLQLAPWQFPLVFIALFLLISGPSVIMAWLKLRQRTLGPLLEASGWAINGKVKINFAVGKELTTKATLPKNAHLELFDPRQKRHILLWLIFFLVVFAGMIFTITLFWHNDIFHLRSQVMSKINKLRHTKPPDLVLPPVTAPNTPATTPTPATVPPANTAPAETKSAPVVTPVKKT